MPWSLPPHDLHLATTSGGQPRRRRYSANIGRQVAEYTAGRPITGATTLEASATGRVVYLWTLEDGEHLLLLTHRRTFLYWEACPDCLVTLRERAVNWLTEPAVPEIG